MSPRRDIRSLPDGNRPAVCYLPIDLASSDNIPTHERD